MKSDKRHLLAILLLAASLRLFVVIVLFGSYQPIDDAAGWHQAAQNLMAGRGLTTNVGTAAYQTPLPALYLAAIYSIFGISVRAVQIVNVLLGIFTVWLIYDFVLKDFGAGPARWAGLFVAVYPMFLFYTGQLLSETLILM